jgi:hypothetical protein
LIVISLYPQRRQDGIKLGAAPARLWGFKSWKKRQYSWELDKKRKGIEKNKSIKRKSFFPLPLLHDNLGKRSLLFSPSHTFPSCSTGTHPSISFFFPPSFGFRKYPNSLTQRRIQIIINLFDKEQNMKFLQRDNKNINTYNVPWRLG